MTTFLACVGAFFLAYGFVIALIRKLKKRRRNRTKKALEKSRRGQQARVLTVSCLKTNRPDI
jgi:hypothetical protein